MRYALLMFGMMSAVLLAACTPEQEQAIQDIMEPGDSGECIIGGCSGQLCIDEGDDGVSTCEWREEYACYRTASCERQANGECGWTQTDALAACLQNPPPMTGEEVTVTDDDATMSGQVRTSYSMYGPEVLADGQTKVLFFHAAWCPVCRQADETLKGIYNKWDGAEPSFEELVALLPQYSVYKVDYDTNLDLRSAYGVTYQHTFVLVDGQGNAIETVQAPSDAALKELIGAQS